MKVWKDEDLLDELIHIQKKLKLNLQMRWLRILMITMVVGFGKIKTKGLREFGNLTNLSIGD